MIEFFRYLNISKLKTIDDLKKVLILDKISPDRSNVKILIIDDEASYITESLKKLNYSNVKCISDYKSSEELEEFQIILCDINNVGMDVHKDKQGFAVYEQVSKMYPYKIIVLYTAYNASDYGTVTDDSIVINKPIQPSELADKLDVITQRFWEPVKAWEYIKSMCVNKGASNKDIAILEDMFVRSFKPRNGNIYNVMRKKYKRQSQLLEYMEIGSEILTILLKIATRFISK